MGTPNCADAGIQSFKNKMLEIFCRSDRFSGKRRSKHFGSRLCLNWLCITLPLFNRTSAFSLQVLTDLKSDNQRLKDENGALIRVISKLSK